MTVIFDPDHEVAVALRAAIVTGSQAVPVTTREALMAFLGHHPDTRAVVVGPTTRAAAALDLAATLRSRYPEPGIVLVRADPDDAASGHSARPDRCDVVDLTDLTALNRAVDSHQDQPGTVGRVITVFSTKGGSGKTTLAANLAVVLADRGSRQVCLVDLDLTYGDVATTLQLFPEHTLADLAGHDETLDGDDLLPLLTPHSPGLAVLAAPVSPAASRQVRPLLVEQTLQVLRRTMDYVVVDTPAGFEDQVLAALDRSDRVILVATLDLTSLKNLTLALETMHLLGYPPDAVRIVLNRADSRVGLAVDDVQSMLGHQVAALVPSSGDVPVWGNRGVPIAVAEPDHPVSLALRELAAAHLTTDHDAAGREPGEAAGGGPRSATPAAPAGVPPDATDTGPAPAGPQACGPDQPLPPPQSPEPPWGAPAPCTDPDAVTPPPGPSDVAAHSGEAGHLRRRGGWFGRGRR